MKQIVVVGGGFAGVYAIKSLLKCKEDFRVTLINPTNYFLFTPLLHEVSTGSVSRHHSSESFRDIFRDKRFQLAKCRAKKIDFKLKKVYLENTSLPFDILVLCQGSTTNYFGVKGAEEYSFGLKKLEDAGKLKSKLIQVLETANDETKPSINVSIVGGGATGVELSAEIYEFLELGIKKNYPRLKGIKANVSLIQRVNRLLPQFDSKVGNEALNRLRKKVLKVFLNSQVSEVNPDTIVVNKKKIQSELTVWCAGIKPIQIQSNSKITDKNGYIRVNDKMEIVGHEGTFALGDCARIDNLDPAKYPAMAQIATQQAMVVSKNIKLHLQGKPLKSFEPKIIGYLISVGFKFGLADIQGIKFKGFFAWWLWRTVYMTKMLSWSKRFRVVYEWTLNLFFPRDTTDFSNEIKGKF